MKVLLSRLQFSVTITYHFLFVPLTVGLALLVAVMQVLVYTHQAEAWERLSRFFGTLFLINFAVASSPARPGVPVRHELVELLGVGGQYLRRPARDGGAARVLPRVDVHRAVAVRRQPAAPAGAHDLNLRGG
jgi:hypothetical protein